MIIVQTDLSEFTPCTHAPNHCTDAGVHLLSHHAHTQTHKISGFGFIVPHVASMFLYIKMKNQSLWVNNWCTLFSGNRIWKRFDVVCQNRGGKNDHRISWMHGKLSAFNVNHHERVKTSPILLSKVSICGYTEKTLHMFFFSVFIICFSGIGLLWLILD